MNKPDPIIPEEMLSAYLDGELSADEQQLVANALQESAELRSLFEELSQLREELRNLPKYELPEDFASQIVRSTQGASQRFTSPSVNEPSANEPSLAAAQQPSVAVKPHRNANQTRFRWIAGIAASAAALLVALWAINPSGLGPNVALSRKAANPKAANSKTVEHASDGTAPMPEAIAAGDAADQMEAEASEPNEGLVDIKLDSGLGGGGLGGEGLGGEGLGGEGLGGNGGRGRSFGLAERMQPPGMSAEADVQSFEFRPESRNDSDLAAFADVATDDSELNVAETGFGRGPDIKRPFDAIVTLALREDQLTLNNTGTQALYYQLDDVAYLYESLARELKRDLNELSKENLKETKFLSQLKGLSIPKNAKLMVLEGTTQQLSSAFAELGTTPSLVKQSKDLRVLGLPQVELLDAQAETTMQRQALRSALPASAAAPASATPAPVVPPSYQAAEKTATAAARRAKSAASSNNPLKSVRESTLDQESLGLQGLEEEAKATAGRYRVLLIVEPK